MSGYPKDPGWKGKATSRAAAEATKEKAPTLLRLCKLALAAHGPKTADEVAALIGRSILSVRPRMSELGDDGEIVDTGDTRPNASGHQATVWGLPGHQLDLFHVKP